MLKTTGLYGHAQNNVLKSLLLLAAFAFVMQWMALAIIAFCLLASGEWGGSDGFIWRVLECAQNYAPLVAIGSMTWAGFAFLFYKSILRKATGLQPLSRSQNMRLFNITEKLAISLGLPVPTLEIIETPDMGAFAMGLSPSTATIGVTRGLINKLNDKELEAVIAHEMTHIRNYDVQLVTVATILCGIIFSIGWTLTYRFREAIRNLREAIRNRQKSVTIKLVLFALAFLLFCVVPMYTMLGLHCTTLLGVLLNPFQNPLIFLALICFTGVIMAKMLRFSISRKREFVADAGAIELTHDPEALISALCKISGRDMVMSKDPMMQAMMIVAPLDGAFSTHPALEERIDAIVKYAAEHLRGLQLRPASARLLPQVPSAGGSDFSIKEMQYPAWISNYWVVIPTVVVVALCYTLLNQGLSGLLNAPQFLKDVWNASPGETNMTLRSTFDSKGSVPPNNSFWENMGPGDIKMMLIYLAIGIPISLFGKFLRSKGIGDNSDFLRSLAGEPSKVMESDWHRATPAQATVLNAASGMPAHHLSRLNQAMEQAIKAQHQQPLPSYQPAPQSTRAVFGKR
jgi:heat shock protein HtpX